MIYRLLIRKGYYFKLLFFHLIFFFSLSLFFFLLVLFIFMVSLSILLISHCRINNGCFHKRFVCHHFLKQFLLLKSNEITGNNKKILIVHAFISFPTKLIYLFNFISKYFVFLIVSGHYICSSIQIINIVQGESLKHS